MKTVVPETLLARLLAFPAGMAPPSAAESQAWQQARRELESRGHPIITQDSGAWQLACGSVHFDPARFAAAHQGSMGRSLEIWERLDSTNARAWEGIAAGMPPGWAVLAEEQQAGRGRQGRRWICPAHGGLLFSVVAPGDAKAAARASLLPLALAAGVCEALRRSTHRDVRLKWPNDLLLQERKLAGLLVEARSGLTDRLVVGCGINVRVPPECFAAHPELRAASLHEDGQPLPARENLLASVLSGLEEALDAWHAGRDGDILQRWSALDTLRGCDVEAHLPQGVERGRALGITETGLLRLRLPSGEERRLAAGDVHLQ